MLGAQVGVKDFSPLRSKKNGASNGTPQGERFLAYHVHGLHSCYPTA
jgi:hypothetical protein